VRANSSSPVSGTTDTASLLRLHRCHGLILCVILLITSTRCACTACQYTIARQRKSCFSLRRAVEPTAVPCCLTAAAAVGAAGPGARCPCPPAISGQVMGCSWSLSWSWLWGGYRSCLLTALTSAEGKPLWSWLVTHIYAKLQFEFLLQSAKK
jgi:hypothetical protein